MTTPFWTNDPTILFNKDYIFELWPLTDMDYEQKLNAITRLIILITILGYILTMSIRLLVVGMITIFFIFVLFKMRKQKVTKSMLNEGFSNSNSFTNVIATETITNPATLETVLKSEFKEGNKKNPFSNVLSQKIQKKSSND